MAQWEENKHPRDEDGKFTSGGGTPAENKKLEEMGIDSKTKNENQTLTAEEQRLKEMGIEISEGIDKDKTESYNKVNLDKVEMKKLTSLNSILNKDNQQLQALVEQSQYSLISKGTQDEIIKPILHEIGFDGLPQKVSNEKYEKLKTDSLELYRGFKIFKHADDFTNGELFVGVGVNGSGTYMAKDKPRAEMYANRGEYGKVVSALLDKNAKIADGMDIYWDERDLSMSFKMGDEIEWGLDNEKMSIICDDRSKRLKTLVALSQGYDAIDLGAGDILVLNRTALIMKEE